MFSRYKNHSVCYLEEANTRLEKGNTLHLLESKFGKKATIKGFYSIEPDEIMAEQSVSGDFTVMLDVDCKYRVFSAFTAHTAIDRFRHKGTKMPFTNS